MSGTRAYRSVEIASVTPARWHCHESHLAPGCTAEYRGIRVSQSHRPVDLREPILTVPVWRTDNSRKRSLRPPEPPCKLAVDQLVSPRQDQHVEWVRLTNDSRRGIDELDGTAPRHNKNRQVGRTKGHCPQIHRVVEVGGDRRRIDRLNVKRPAIETRPEHPTVGDEAVGIGGIESRSRAITCIA
jgi:hypothetical protein